MKKNAQGSVLLVSLVLLLVMMLAGTTAVIKSGGEEKVLGSYRQHLLSFHSAEMALEVIEEKVDSGNFRLSSFNDKCLNGLCFFGLNPQSPGSCSLLPTNPWQDRALWNSSASHGEITVALMDRLFTIKYLVEFRCYVSRLEEGLVPDSDNEIDWAPVYRITVLQEDSSLAGKAMLQSRFLAKVLM